MYIVDEVIPLIKQKSWRWVLRNRGMYEPKDSPPGEYFAHVFEEGSGLNQVGRFVVSGIHWGDDAAYTLYVAYVRAVSSAADNEAERSRSI